MAKKPRKKNIEPLPSKAEVQAPATAPLRATRPRKQQIIPGTEHKELPELTDLAETYRTTRDERMDLGRQERQHLAALLAAVERMQASGALPVAKPGEKVTVYAYEDEDGQMREVIDDFQRKVRVRVAKNGDDGGEE